MDKDIDDIKVNKKNIDKNISYFESQEKESTLWYRYKAENEIWIFSTLSMLFQN